ncbi:MAG: DegT/DnrJ/EryC1/StrS family aminotransferase [Rhodospirillales bacterium]|nr:DegT/DnrJ/EryC1/StrS family aminotransferase [Rhodospirillales bacterium]
MSVRSVPFFNYQAVFKAKEDEYMAVLRDVLARGAYIMQRDLSEFEDNLKSFLKVKHVFGVADGTNAIILGLRACGVGPGDEVILPSHTYVATAAAVQLVGGTPVPVDIRADDHMLDAAAAEAAISPRTKAIIAVQVNGRTCDMDALRDVADRHGVMVLEDAAQGLGSRFKGKCAGTFGKFGTFSFYPAKLLGCFGDGGAVVTDDDAIAERLGLLRDHGRNADGQVVEWGTNSRLDNMQAAILDFKLKTYDEDMARRRQIAAAYQSLLGDLEQLRLPPAPDADPRHFDVYQNYEIEADRRDELRAFLKERGIGAMPQWAGTPIHGFRELGFDMRLPVTDRFFERCLMIPMNMSLSDDDVAYVADNVREFYRRA